MNKIYINYIIFIPSYIYGEILDDFSNHAFRYNLSTRQDFNEENFYHNEINKGEQKIKVTRETGIGYTEGFGLFSNTNFMVPDGENQLVYRRDYERSRVPTINDITPNQLIYKLSSPIDLSSDPLMKINFSDMSKKFTGRFHLKDQGGSIRYCKHKFSPTCLSPLINFNTSGQDLDSNVNPFDFSGIDEINFSITSKTFSSLAFRIQSIEIGEVPVPEPFSCTMIGAGLFTFIKKRGCKKSNNFLII